MKETDPGHEYHLNILDDKTCGTHETLQFVKRIGLNYPGNQGVPQSGTTSQEVMRALIERAKYVNGQIPHQANELVIKNLRDCIWALEERAAEQHNRKLPERPTDGYAIEYIPTCGKCGHIFCKH